MKTPNSLYDIADNTMSDGRRGRILLTLCLAVLVAQIDTAVVNLATRAIDTDLKAGISGLQWILDSYNLAYAALLLTGGLLADLYGRRRIFMVGASIFTAASLLCAAAWSTPVLISGRALAGLGAALLIPASLAIIRVVWSDPVERGRVLGIWAACNGLAMALGPTLGGLLIERFGWRSIFLVVVPISVIALLLAVRSIPESSEPDGRRFDGFAQILGAAALGGISFAAIEAHSAPILATSILVIAVVAFVLFLRVEAKMGGAALVPLAIFNSKTFCAALTATAGMTFGMYGVLFLLPFTWQGAGQLGPLGSGLALMPMALVFVATSPFSNTLVERHGARLTISGGVAIIACGLMVIAFGAGSTSLIMAETGLGLAGLGMGFATGPLMGAAVGTVNAARSGTASALVNVARMVGATIGVALLGAAFHLANGVISPT